MRLFPLIGFLELNLKLHEVQYPQFKSSLEIDSQLPPCQPASAPGCLHVIAPDPATQVQTPTREVKTRNFFTLHLSRIVCTQAPAPCRYLRFFESKRTFEL